jgi:phosphoglycolate phosphatase
MAQIRACAAVLFDFDFTLADSSAGIVDCVNHALVTIGRGAAPAEAIRRCIGLTLPEVLRSFHGVCDADEVARFVGAFQCRADVVMESSTTLYPRAIECVGRLRAAGIRTGIVSTKYRWRIESILAQRSAAGLFDIIVGLEDVREPKPDPEGLRLAMRQLDVAPADSLYLGDHHVDVEAARRARVPFLGVLTGMTTAAEFRQLGVNCVADLSELDRPSSAGRSAAP